MRYRSIDLLARHGDTFTFEDALGITGLSQESLKKLIYRLERNGWIERIEKEKMFYLYGFSAKKTSRFGVIDNLKEEYVNVCPDDEDKNCIFSSAYTKHNIFDKDGVCY